jgi:hypothetical protein
MSTLQFQAFFRLKGALSLVERHLGDALGCIQILLNERLDLQITVVLLSRTCPESASH